jgi:hypothetical protein
LSPVKTIWQFLRGSWLGHRVFRSCAGIIDPCGSG